MFGSGAAIGTAIIAVRHKTTLMGHQSEARSAFCVVAVGTTSHRVAAFLTATKVLLTIAATAADFGWFVPFSSLWIFILI